MSRIVCKISVGVVALALLIGICLNRPEGYPLSKQEKMTRGLARVCKVCRNWERRACAYYEALPGGNCKDIGEGVIVNRCYGEYGANIEDSSTEESDTSVSTHKCQISFAVCQNDGASLIWATIYLPEEEKEKRSCGTYTQCLAPKITECKQDPPPGE